MTNTISRHKGSKFNFKCKQSAPMPSYEGAIAFNPASASWQNTVSVFFIGVCLRETPPSVAVSLLFNLKDKIEFS